MPEQVNMRILWADDQIEVARTLSLSVADNRQHTIQFVDSGEKALRLLMSTFFDIVILDLAMPPGAWGGLWLLEQLRDTGNRVPVIVLSGEGKQPQTIHAIRLGARDFVTKEGAASELADRLGTVVGKLWDQIHIDVLTAFPSALALPYKRYVTSATPQARMRALIGVYEQAVRLAAVIGLAEARSEEVAVPIQVGMSLARPSFGNWRETVRALRQRLSPGSAMIKFWSAIDDRTVDDVVKVRNDLAHGYDFGDRKAESWLVDHDAALRTAFSRLWQKFPFRLFSVRSSGYNGEHYVHSTVLLVGESAVLPTEVVSLKDSLILHRVYFQRATQTEQVVSVHPLVWADGGEELNSWKVYFLDGWQVGRDTCLTGQERLRYLELWTGSRADQLDHVVELLPEFLWRSVDLG